MAVYEITTEERCFGVLTRTIIIHDVECQRMPKVGEQDRRGDYVTTVVKIKENEQTKESADSDK